MQPDGDGEELSVRAGTQAGWTLQLTGLQRCMAFGHELGDLAHFDNGLIVGYCVRCEDRVEIPWFRGGTIRVLAQHMTDEAKTMTHPAPSVATDLTHVIGLLIDDIRALQAQLRETLDARAVVEARQP